VNAWHEEGILLWKEDWVTNTFSAASEVTGTDSLIYTCIRPHTSAASNRPITGADWTTYWKLAGSTGGVWATSTSYTTPGVFTVATDTVDITRAFIRKDGSDYPVRLVSAQEYADVIDKGETSNLPYIMWVHKKKTPEVYLYPQPDNTDIVLHYHRIVNITETETGTASLDVNKQKLRALVWNLAREVALDYGVTDSRYNIISSTADRTKKILLENDIESTNDDFIEGAY
jgi:hypothetical protein